MLIHATAAGFIALNHAMRFQSWQALMKKLLSLCLLVLMATRCCSLLPLSAVCFYRVCYPLKRCLRC